MKTIRDRFTELRGSMPEGIGDVQIMEMAEQDAEFERQWRDFQAAHPQFEGYEIALDLDAGKRDPAWLALQKQHPRFAGYRPVRKSDREQEDRAAWRREEAARRENLAADLTSGLALGVALHRARAGKKTSLRMLENTRRAMTVLLQIVAAAVAIFAAALVGFQAGQESVFDQLPAGQVQEIRERTNTFFNSTGEQK